MAKKVGTDLALPGQPAGGVLATKPDFLKRDDYQIVGMDEAKQYILLPRMKVVQKSAGRELFDKGFGVGDMIITPAMDLLARIGRNAGGAPDEQGPPVLITPLYFMVEWCTWNPIALKGSEPAIAYRTRNPGDPIVAKSRSRQLRMEPLRDGTGAPRMGSDNQPMSQRHVEHLNWVVIAHNVEGITDPFVVSFSRGEHFSGSKFAGLLRQRKASPFDCVFEMRSTYRPSRGKGDWYGVELSNPTDAAQWVTEQQHAAFEKAYADMVEMDKDRRVTTDLESDQDIPEEVVDPNAPRTM